MLPGLEGTDAPPVLATSRFAGYVDFADPSSSIRVFTQWFRYWDWLVKNHRVEAAEAGETYQMTWYDFALRAVQGAVRRCLEPTGWTDVRYSAVRDQLECRHEVHGTLPVAGLSDGIRTMIGMVADIAFRAAQLNPHFGEHACAHSPGVVCIDEVDMHLHPTWQQVVLHALAEAFPLMQFVVTTHSPQVVSTVHRDNVRVLPSLDRVQSPISRATANGHLSSEKP